MTPAERARRAVGSWDALTLLGDQRPYDGELYARQGTKLATLLAKLATCGSANTSSLAALSDLTTRQVWGLLKGPRSVGQVQFSGGRWELVLGFGGRDVERAAALLRDRGWRCEPPCS